MFEHFKTDQKKSILALLCQLAEVDQNVDAIEYRFLEDITAQLGLEKKDLDEVAMKPDVYKFVPPSSEQERMSILYYMLFLLRVDGRVTEKEEILIHKAGFRLGFNPSLIGEMIEVMKEHMNSEIPPDALLEKIRKYMN